MNEQNCPLYKNKRIAMLSAVAYVTVIICLIATVLLSDGISDYAQGVITLVLGKYLGYTDQVYAYDFGTTRSSSTKDATIAALSSSAVDQNLNKEQK